MSPCCRRQPTYPIPQNAEQVAQQALGACQRAWKDGVKRQQLELLLPLIGASDIDDWCTSQLTCDNSVERSPAYVYHFQLPKQRHRLLVGPEPDYHHLPVCTNLANFNCTPYVLQ